MKMDTKLNVHLHPYVFLDLPLVITAYLPEIVNVTTFSYCPCSHPGPNLPNLCFCSHSVTPLVDFHQNNWSGPAKGGSIPAFH